MTNFIQPVDAFLWDGLGAPTESDTPRRMTHALIEHGVVIDVTPIPADEPLVPAGMFNQWPFEVLLQLNKPFTGLVVLIDMVRTHRRSSHDAGAVQLVTACVASLLGEKDFGCRTTEDEFVMVCPGVEGAEAQRRLNRISERLWELHQSGRSACSLLFSWGGVGTRQKPLSEAMAAAVDRMNHINRNRISNSRESARSHRKPV
jgi:GGDEF domain-containing protein